MRIQKVVPVWINHITPFAKEELLIEQDYVLKLGPFSSLAGVSAVGFISTSKARSKDWPDVGYFMSDSGVHKTLADDFTYILGLKPGILHKYYGPHIGKDANFVLVMLGKSKSVGEIRLASRSPFDKPIIDPKYFSHPDDIIAMKEGLDWPLTTIEAH